MKLAEALQERADLIRRLGQLRSRMSANTQVQDGEEPPEDPKELMAEFDRCADRLEELICRINLTNTAVKAEGRPLTELLARRDVLKTRIEAYRELADRAAVNNFRMTRSEIKTVATVSAREVQKRCDDLSRDFRELDNVIQAANWSTELL